MIGPLGYLFFLSTLVLGWQLYRTQEREAALLKINVALRARIAALQAEIRVREAARQMWRNAGRPLRRGVASGAPIRSTTVAYVGGVGYRIEKWHMEGDVMVIDRAILDEVSASARRGQP